MTITELRELTDFPFEGFALYGDPPEKVMFAAPIPSPYGDGLNWHKTDSGDIMVDDDIADWWDAWEQYINSLMTSKRKNRTRKQAAEQGNIAEVPKEIALITAKNYQFAMTPIKGKNAHLQPLVPSFVEALRAMAPSEINDIPFVKGYDNSQQAASNIDRPTLQVIYSIFLKKAEKMAENLDDLIKRVSSPGFEDESITIYIPDFLKMIGMSPNHNRSNEKAVLDKIDDYVHIYGVLINEHGEEECLPLIRSMGTNRGKNTVKIASPYLNTLIKRIVQDSIKKTKQDKPMLKRNGQILTLPMHSYMVKTEITKERNRRAIEIVYIVVTLIERRGNYKPPEQPPHIKIRTIVERCPDLKYALDTAKTTSDKSKILKRAFSKAWQLLETKTTLREHYKNIKFPSAIPAYSDMDMTVYFMHEGKTKERGHQDN